ncbi:hypothetical protein Dda_4326 [Drechslerella dactyloides]|uniref:Uncharacterized protein n=1 Tax=Drechslerella dactyloides TaxID=74499 RepID=A0AAD6IWP0_DREDA|nr:hypothetical protein Dda_4326 [Drechslerella dactyloides]
MRPKPGKIPSAGHPSQPPRTPTVITTADDSVVRPFEAAEAVVVGNLGLPAAAATVRLEFQQSSNAFVLRVMTPASQYIPAGNVIRGVVPDDIELARLVLAVREDVGSDMATGRRRSVRVAAAASASRAGRYALRVRLEAAAVDRRLLQIEIPETLVVGDMHAVGEAHMLGDAVFGMQSTTFAQLSAIQQEAIGEWTRMYWENEAQGTVGNAGAVSTAKARDLLALLRHHNLKPSSADGRAIIELVTAQEVGRFRRFLESQPAYSHARDLLQRFQQLIETTGSQPGSWVRFDIINTVERTTPAATRARGSATEPPRPDVRQTLNRLDWSVAQQTFSQNINDTTATAPSNGDGIRGQAHRLGVPETPATKTAVQLAQFGLVTPQIPAPPSSSPHTLSIYADTECRSPATPTKQQEYKARHARAANEWPQEALESRHEQRELSPGSSHNGDENVIGEDEWPMYPGGHLGTDILAGHPGGLSLGLVRSGGSFKRKLTAASFRSPTPRGAKRARQFPPPEPYRPNAVVETEGGEVQGDEEVEDMADENDEDDEGGGVEDHTFRSKFLPPPTAHYYRLQVYGYSTTTQRRKSYLPTGELMNKRSSLKAKKDSLKSQKKVSFESDSDPSDTANDDMATGGQSNRYMGETAPVMDPVSGVASLRELPVDPPVGMNEMKDSMERAERRLKCRTNRRRIKSCCQLFKIKLPKKKIETTSTPAPTTPNK